MHEHKRPSEDHSTISALNCGINIINKSSEPNQKILIPPTQFIFDTLFETHSQKMNDIITILKRAAFFKRSIAIYGERGTGKDVFAQLYAKLLNKQLFVINCGSLGNNVDMVNSQFFGHVHGSFTDARETRTGILEMADQQCCQIDELQTLPAIIQPTLLRYFNDQKISKLGEEHLKRKVNVIHILTFNETFHSLVSSGKLRPDLADRFNGTKITIPPLRDRKEDIPNIIFGTINQSDNPVDYITQEALDFLMSMEFKGNFRDIQNIISAAILFCYSDTLDKTHIQRGLEMVQDERLSETHLYDEFIRSTSISEFKQLKRALSFKDIVFKHNFDIAKISSETQYHPATVYRQLKKYGLERK